MTEQEREQIRQMDLDQAVRLIDPEQEFNRLRDSRRLELRSGPFRGFDSPPGRF